MKATELMHALADLICRHGDLDVYAEILLCEPASEPAREVRFAVTEVEYGIQPDALEPNHGPGVVLRVHQNESLRSWE